MVECPQRGSGRGFAVICALCPHSITRAVYMTNSSVLEVAFPSSLSAATSPSFCYGEKRADIPQVILVAGGDGQPSLVMLPLSGLRRRLSFAGLSWLRRGPLSSSHEAISAAAVKEQELRGRCSSNFFLPLVAQPGVASSEV